MVPVPVPGLGCWLVIAGSARLSPGFTSASRSPSVAGPPVGKHAEPPN
jgi:hypothetical protein